MKILIFSYLFPNKNFPYCGIFNYSRAKALERTGCEVEVIAPINLSPYLINLFPKFRLIENIKLFKKMITIPEIEFIGGIKVYHPKWWKLPDKLFWKFHSDIMHFSIGKKILKIVKDFLPDLILSTWLNPFASYSEFFKRKLSVINFALAEGSDLLIHPYLFKGWDKVQEKINNNCELVIAVSNKMKIYIDEKTNLQNVEVIRNGYDDCSFKYSEKNRFQRREKVKIISVGNFYNVKGQDILLEAIRLLKVPMELTLVGNGPELPKCREFVLSHGLEKKVNFAGEIPHNQLSKILLQHDIFCLPSRSEGFPAAPLEAMGCGLPVVSSNVGDMEEVIVEGFNGFLFQSESITDLAEKLMLASQINWDGKEISNWVGSNFSWDNWSKRILEKYYSFSIEKMDQVLVS